MPDRPPGRRSRGNVGRLMSPAASIKLRWPEVCEANRRARIGRGNRGAAGQIGQRPPVSNGTNRGRAG
jgi:hypothetical protein